MMDDILETGLTWVSCQTLENLLCLQQKTKKCLNSSMYMVQVCQGQRLTLSILDLYHNPSYFLYHFITMVSSFFLTRSLFLNLRFNCFSQTGCSASSEPSLPHLPLQTETTTGQAQHLAREIETQALLHRKHFIHPTISPASKHLIPYLTLFVCFPVMVRNTKGFQTIKRKMSPSKHGHTVPNPGLNKMEIDF